jgi:hypothetical protein
MADYLISKKEHLKSFYTPSLYGLNDSFLSLMFSGFKKSTNALKESMIFYYVFGNEDFFEKEYYHYSKYRHGNNPEIDFKGLNYNYLQNNLDFSIFREELLEHILSNKKFFLNEIESKFDTHDSEIRFKVFLKEQIEALKNAYSSINEINKKELNFIDREVFELLVQSYKNSYLSLKEKYFDIVPHCFDFDTFPVTKSSSRKDLLNRLIGKETTNEYIQFEKYEKKLIPQYLNESRDKWLKTPASFIRFYNYCENKEIFKYHLKDSSKGVEWLRNLYEFYEGGSIDSHSKRQKQNTTKTKSDFNFLDII